MMLRSRNTHRFHGLRRNNGTQATLAQWFLDKALPGLLVGAVAILLLILFFVTVAAYIQDGNPCDTMFGGRDIRCIGYYSRHR